MIIYQQGKLEGLWFMINLFVCFVLRDGVPVFTYSRDKGEFWGVLLENCYVYCLRMEFPCSPTTGIKGSTWEHS